MADLQACLLVLDTKIDTYVEAEKGTHFHDDTKHFLEGKQVGARAARS